MSRREKPGTTLNLPAGIGKTGESIAATYLERNGYVILRANYRVREGEIDIIAEKEGQLVFVEVKTRRADAFGPPEDSLTTAKMARLIKVAQTYLSEVGREHAYWRIDLIAIVMNRSGRVLRIEHIENAVTED